MYIETNLLKVFRGNSPIVSKLSANENNGRGQDTEEKSKSEDNSIPNTHAQWSFASKVGLLAQVLGKGRGVFRLESHGV